MINLCIRTDSEEAFILIFDTSKNQILACKKWISGRLLSTQIHTTINDIVTEANLNYSDIEGIVVYSGPGSFTSLRIGFSVANAFSGALNLPIASDNSTDWYKSTPVNNKSIVPLYGSDPVITKQKK